LGAKHLGRLYSDFYKILPELLCSFQQGHRQLPQDVGFFAKRLTLFTAYSGQKMQILAGHKILYGFSIDFFAIKILTFSRT